MASYTMQLRDYIEGQSQMRTMSYRERIEFGRKRLFDFEYPIFDENYRNVFETHFIRNFYMREIGFETEELFKFQLETWMLIHFPYFNKLWESELLQYNPLHNAEMNISSNKKQDKNQNDQRDIKQNSKSDSQMKNDVTGSSTQSNEQDGTSVDDNFERKISSETPDGRLNITTKDGEGIIDYANTINEDNENNKRTTHSEGKGKEDSTSKEVGEAGNVASANQNDVLASEINEIEDYIEHRVGKVGTDSYAKLVNDYRNALLRVEQQIFAEMQQLFMLVY